MTVTEEWLAAESITDYVGNTREGLGVGGSVDDTQSPASESGSSMQVPTESSFDQAFHDCIDV